MSLGEIVSVVNPDGTLVGSAGAPVTGTVTANAGTPPSRSEERRVGKV